MYRAVALRAQNCGADWDNETEILQILDDVDIDIRHIDGQQRVFLNGADVTAAVRTAEMGLGASKVSAYGDVRKKLVAMQQDMAKGRGVVMDGRDIGTAVLPNAPLKIYLTADVQVRARRRCGELEELGLPWDFDEITKQIEKRDYEDSNRAFSPLKKATGAIEIDSGGLSIDEIVEMIVNKHMREI